MNTATANPSDKVIPPRPELKKGPRFYVGLGLFVFSLISPVFIPLVIYLPVSREIKGIISTLLVVGFPDLLTLISVILLGKETIGYFIFRIKDFFRIKRPVRPIGRVRYLTGMIMFWGTIMMSVVELNYPPLREIYGDYFIEASIAWNLLFITSLIVLGGNFWEKLRSLFVYDAYAVFPREQYEEAGCRDMLTEECVDNR